MRAGQPDPRVYRFDLKLKRLRYHHLNLEVLFRNGGINASHNTFCPCPDTKTQAQWTRVFEKKDFDQFGCQEEWSALSEGDLSDIYAYLHDHAADSPTPAKCK